MFFNPMANRDEYYRKQAAEAEEQARRARNPTDKAAWLRLVRDWLSLLPRRTRTPEERFDDQASAEGTRQNISDAKQ